MRMGEQGVHGRDGSSGAPWFEGCEAARERDGGWSPLHSLWASGAQCRRSLELSGEQAPQGCPSRGLSELGRVARQTQGLGHVLRYRGRARRGTTLAQTSRSSYSQGMDTACRG